MKYIKIFFCLLLMVFFSCSKKSSNNPPPPPPVLYFTFNSLTVNGSFNGYTYYNINTIPVLKFSFSTTIDQASVANAVSIKDKNATAAAFTFTLENGDSTLVIKPSSSLQFITPYIVTVSTALASKEKSSLRTAVSLNLVTTIDSTDKFARVSDEQLLDIVQRQTFKYFWEFGHPVSGLARERNTSGDVVTSGGSGFGIMAIVAAVSRNFITRTEGLARMQKIVDFLTNKAQRFHGAFPHWLNGTTGEAIAFSTKDNGADLVETSYLMQGLLTARQYFNSIDVAETSLRTNINALWNEVEWNWFRQNNQNVLYWHWSPTFNWDINMQIKGWNEALIVYVLAASSNTDSISKIVYASGWADNGTIKNGNSYYGVQLPLGPPMGGPLFFAHYSFLGINPDDLTDAYANYWSQNVAHTLINYNYCKANPKNYNGYSDACWGLTASDDNKTGYSAHAPDNDLGIISPTAAISSLPYTSQQSMNALRFFYYKLGDKIFKEYGFVDAFNLTDVWFAGSFLAIDQGPQIVMIENYRTGILWSLFMSCPEIKRGMKQLGFSSPNL